MTSEAVIFLKRESEEKRGELEGSFSMQERKRWSGGGLPLERFLERRWEKRRGVLTERLMEDFCGCLVWEKTKRQRAERLVREEVRLFQEFRWFWRGTWGVCRGTKPHWRRTFSGMKAAGLLFYFGFSLFPYISCWYLHVVWFAWGGWWRPLVACWYIILNSCFPLLILMYLVSIMKYPIILPIFAFGAIFLT